MAVIKCKMCGGDLDLTPESSIATCQYCGSVQTVPNQDDEKKLIQFGRANRLRYGCEFDKAAGVYESIVADFPQEAEAYWGLVLCKYGIEYVTDPATGKKIPTCHRSSFSSVLEDDNYQQALENADEVAARVYREEAKTIERLRKAIVEVSSREEPYDIFICYKETDKMGERTLDSVIAQDIYDALTERDYRVFFSRVTLEDKLGIDFEPYIFAALHSAKIMLAVGTDYDYYHAVWVKNEWSRFLQLMAEDKQKHLIPCFKGVEPEDLPVPFQRLQGQDMGKIGALQDLLRGIEKLLPRAQEAEKDALAAQQGSSVAVMLERGKLALEDGDWKNADRFFEEVLNREPKNPEAYFGKALAQAHCPGAVQFVNWRLQQTLAVEVKTARLEGETVPEGLLENYVIPGYFEYYAVTQPYREFSWEYKTVVQGREAQKQQEQALWSSGLLGRAIQFSKEGSTALQAKQQLDAVLEERVQKAKQAEDTAKSQILEAYNALEKQVKEKHAHYLEKRERIYIKQKEILEKDSPKFDEIKAAIRVLSTMKDYKESNALIEKATQRRDALVEQAREKAAARAAQLHAEEKKKKIILWSLIGVTVLAVFLFAILYTTVIRPAVSYREAEKLLAKNEKGKAAVLFGKMGDYRDARERSFAVWDEVAQRETVSAGGKHTVGLRNDGTVVAVGNNEYGECDVSQWKDIVAVSAGYKHTVALRSDGTVIANGDNSFGQCNVYQWKNIVAISAGKYHTVGLCYDGTVVAAGDNGCDQCDVSQWKDIVAVSAGAYHTVGLKADGTATAAGTKSSGQCNVIGRKNITAISAGNDYTLLLYANGEVGSAGVNRQGACNVTDLKEIAAIAAGNNFSILLRKDGCVLALGNANNAEGWKNVIAISAGDANWIGLCSDGTVLAGGYEGNGACDVFDWTDIRLPGKK